MNAVVCGIFRIANQIHENLEDLRFFREDLGSRLKIPDNVDGVSGQSAEIHSQGVFHERRSIQRLDDADHRGVGLLHRDDLFDVIDIALERLRFCQQALSLRQGMHGE